jgi:hypothetical protein
VDYINLFAKQIIEELQQLARILGKQKLSGIKIPPNSKDHKVDCMGHFSNIPGKVGHLWLVRKKESV